MELQDYLSERINIAESLNAKRKRFDIPLETMGNIHRFCVIWPRVLVMNFTTKRCCSAAVLVFLLNLMALLRAVAVDFMRH